MDRRAWLALGSQRVRHDWAAGHTHACFLSVNPDFTTSCSTHDPSQPWPLSWPLSPLLFNSNAAEGHHPPSTSTFQTSPSLSDPTQESSVKMFPGPRLPWWLSGEQSACWYRTHRFHAQSEKTPHADEQLSRCTTATEPVLQSLRPATAKDSDPRPVLPNKRRHHSEKPTDRTWRAALARCN